MSEPAAPSFETALKQLEEIVQRLEKGELSLEDVRREVFAAFADELWSEIVQKQRAAARIEWKVEEN